MVIFAIIALLLVYGEAYKITQLEVPPHADPRRPAELSCHYSAHAQDPPLHSVKWYRDDDEMFRYTPRQNPETRVFNVSGVSVSAGNCSEFACTINLSPPRTHSLTASYTCEVSTEGPRFDVAKKTKQMTVAAYPLRDPVMTGVPSSAMPEDEFLVNCTSDYSLPPADITYYLDDEKLSPQRESWQSPVYSVSPADDFGLRASWRTAHIRVPAHSAARGRATLRCEASLPLRPPHVKLQESHIIVPKTPHLSKFTSGTSAVLQSEHESISFIVLTYFVYLKSSAFR